MEIVQNFEFRERGTRGKYKKLYDEFLALPHGTAVKFSEGTDFMVPAAKFAVSLRTGLWNRGMRAKVAVRGGDVYAQITGPRAAQQPPPQPEPAPEPVRRKARKPRVRSSNVKASTA